MLNGICQTQEDKYHFYKGSKIMKLIKAESRMGFTRAGNWSIRGDTRQGV